LWICLLLAVAVGLPMRSAEAGIFDTFDGAIDTIQAGFDYIWPDDIEVEDFSVRLGVGIGVTPDYTGSDDYRYRIVPLIDIRYKDHWAFQGSKFRYNLIREGGFYAGPLMNYLFGRDSKRNPALAGLEDISDTVQVGAFVEYRRASLVANADFRKALGAGQGMAAQVTVAHGLYHTEKFALGAAMRAMWGSEKNVQTNFGITAAQSLASGHPVFDAAGGLSSVGVSLLGRYQLSERWRLESLIAVFRLFGDANDSPLVKGAGSPTQGLGGIGLRYTF
jgi:outer membrane protein